MSLDIEKNINFNELISYYDSSCKKESNKLPFIVKLKRFSIFYIIISIFSLNLALFGADIYFSKEKFKQSSLNRTVLINTYHQQLFDSRLPIKIFNHNITESLLSLHQFDQLNFTTFKILSTSFLIRHRGYVLSDNESLINYLNNEEEKLIQKRKEFINSSAYEDYNKDYLNTLNQFGDVFVKIEEKPFYSFSPIGLGFNSLIKENTIFFEKKALGELYNIYLFSKKENYLKYINNHSLDYNEIDYQELFVNFKKFEKFIIKERESYLKNPDTYVFSIDRFKPN